MPRPKPQTGPTPVIRTSRFMGVILAGIRKPVLPIECPLFSPYWTLGGLASAPVPETRELSALGLP